jgi:hypothetical protein
LHSHSKFVFIADDCWHHDRMARREQLDYLLARLRVQDKYLEVLTEISSNLVAEVSTLYIYSWQVVMQY